MSFDGTSVGLASAFLAGVASFLSPCVLPLVPGYVSYVAGQSVETLQREIRARLSALALAASFVLGFSTVFVALGAGATGLGQFLLQHRYSTNLAGGAVIIAFGFMMTGWLKLPWLQRDLRLHLRLPGGRPLGAYLLGTAFAFGWTPCIGPVLGAILTAAAVSLTASQGVALLATYSLGLGLPFLAAALFTGSFLARIRALRRTGRLLQAGAGAVMILMGVAVMTGKLAVFSYWLLEAFPILGKIG